MKVKTELELAKAEALRVARAYVRLKHSLAADRELATLLPEIEEKLNEAAMTGKAYHLDMSAWLSD